MRWRSIASSRRGRHLGLRGTRLDRRDREVTHLERTTTGEDDGAFEHRFQLAHVAGPVMRFEPRENLGVELVSLRCTTSCRGQELMRERSDPIAMLAERRDDERGAVESVEQIATKPSLVDLGRQIAVRRRHETDVECDRLHRPDARDLARLDRAEHLHLDGLRQLADLVEKQRAVLRRLEEPDALLRGAGERSDFS